MLVLAVVQEHFSVREAPAVKNRSSPAPPLDVFHLYRPQAVAGYSQKRGFFRSIKKSARNGNKLAPWGVCISEQSCPGERFGRAGLAGSGALRDAGSAASRCCF